MTTSIITKKKIGKAFKQLSTNYSFQKISVGQIMEQAGIRRQTFYNHFLDKYELLEWIFQTELNEQITDNLSYISGLELLKELCYFFEKNKDFYQQLFSIVDQNDFSSYFLQYCQQLVEKIIIESECKQTIYWKNMDRQVFIQYHSLALTNWIKDSLLHSPNLLIQHSQTVGNYIIQSLHYLSS